MNADRATGTESRPMRWTWIVVGVIVGGALIALFLNAVDRYLDRPATDGLIISLCVLLVGILIGWLSRGETLREAAVAGLMLSVLTLALVAFQLRVPVPTAVWLLGPFYALGLALLGGYVGEMLQGTLEEAHVDRAVDWSWVLVSVLVGFTVSTYAVLVTRALWTVAPATDLWIFAGAFLLTGLIVGFFSPGRTLVEPAMAAGGMIVAHAGLVALFIDPAPAVSSVLLVFAGGTLLALLGGWLGETLQSRLRRADGPRAG